MLAFLDLQKTQAQAFTQMAGSFQTWIESFKVDGPTELRLPADAEAWQRETVAEMEQAGLPVGATELDRLKWIAHNVDFGS